MNITRIQAATLGASADATPAATAILTAALNRGIHVGTDGDELVLLASARVPRGVRRWFEVWLNNFRDEVIAVIEADVAARS
jgi:hypothetical protein